MPYEMLPAEYVNGKNNRNKLVDERQTIWQMPAQTLPDIPGQGSFEVSNKMTAKILKSEFSETAYKSQEYL